MLPEVPIPPSPPLSPPPAPEAGRGWLSIFLASLLGGMSLTILSLLTLGVFGVAAVVFLFLGLGIGVQYLIWGWWLGPALRRADADESSPPAAD